MLVDVTSNDSVSDSKTSFSLQTEVAVQLPFVAEDDDTSFGCKSGNIPACHQDKRLHSDIAILILLQVY